MGAGREQQSHGSSPQMIHSYRAIATADASLNEVLSYAIQQSLALYTTRPPHTGTDSKVITSLYKEHGVHAL